MTVRSTLVDTTLVGSKGGNGIKRKVTVALLAIVGVSILLRFRGGDTQPTETEEQSKSEGKHESTSAETTPDESTSEPTINSESMTESLTGGQRELDMFDMLAIFAAAITEARDEYHKRTGR